VEQNACYIKSEAVLRIGQQMEMPLPILTTFAFPLPLFFRDTFYDFVAENRYLVFGRTESCRLSDDRFTDRFVN
jgi:predicted DCC family thiol-disulfide oxidoreductase YuxK